MAILLLVKVLLTFGTIALACVLNANDGVSSVGAGIEGASRVACAIAGKGGCSTCVLTLYGVLPIEVPPLLYVPCGCVGAAAAAAGTGYGLPNTSKPPAVCVDIGSATSGANLIGEDLGLNTGCLC